MTAGPAGRFRRLSGLRTNRRSGIALVVLLILPFGSLSAQIDYRNLEDDRPTRIEDAYPIERHAFEFLLPWRYERESGGSVHSFSPELSHGLLPNLQVGLKLPLAGAHDGSERTWGLAGLRLFSLYNFNTESGSLPAFSLRADGAFPVGGLAGDGSRLTLKGILTRSFGLTRLHANGAYTLGDDERAAAAAEPAARWWYGLAVDRTFYRKSTLVVVELYALRERDAAPVEVNASLGLRRQLSPLHVIDLGVSRRLREQGPDLEVTIGVSRAFAIAGLLPRATRGAE
jgi:hypothetical protein